MPEYDFICTDAECKTEFSFFLDRHDLEFPDCIECGKPVRRLIAGGTTFITLGGGWTGKAYGQSKPLKDRK